MHNREEIAIHVSTETQVSSRAWRLGYWRLDLGRMVPRLMNAQKGKRDREMLKGREKRRRKTANVCTRSWPQEELAERPVCLESSKEDGGHAIRLISLLLILILLYHSLLSYSFFITSDIALLSFSGSKTLYKPLYLFLLLFSKNDFGINRFSFAFVAGIVYSILYSFWNIFIKIFDLN